jgi:hypothetical protein
MGHISQAWTNLAPPSVNFLTDCATESHRACGDCDYGLFPCCYGVSRFCSPDRALTCAFACRCALIPHLNYFKTSAIFPLPDKVAASSWGRVNSAIDLIELSAS